MIFLLKYSQNTHKGSSNTSEWRAIRLTYFRENVHRHPLLKDRNRYRPIEKASSSVTNNAVEAWHNRIIRHGIFHAFSYWWLFVNIRFTNCSVLSNYLRRFCRMLRGRQYGGISQYTDRVRLSGPNDTNNNRARTITMDW